MLTVLLLTLAFSLVINILMFFPAYHKQTDHFTGLTYTLSFLLIAFAVLWYNGTYSLMHLVLMMMVGLWSLRLGGYLFRRIRKIGVDHRYELIRHDAKKYFIFWFMQGISIWVLALPYIIGLSKANLESVSITGAIIQGFGIGIWAIGFVMETIADHQRFLFRINPKNDGKFIQDGMYKKNRHPNYLGEIMCWVGIFIFVSPFLEGIEWLSIVSPIWILILLVFLSGLPIIERSMKKRYGNEKAYKEYVKQSYRIFPYIY